MSDFDISMIFGLCRIFPGQTVRDIAKPFSLALSAYKNSLLPVHFDTKRGLMFSKKNDFMGMSHARFRKFFSTSAQRLGNFSRYIGPRAVSIVLNERTDFKLYLPTMI